MTSVPCERSQRSKTVGAATARKDKRRVCVGLTLCNNFALFVAVIALHRGERKEHFHLLFNTRIMPRQVSEHHPPFHSMFSW